MPKAILAESCSDLATNTASTLMKLSVLRRLGEKASQDSWIPPT